MGSRLDGDGRSLIYESGRYLWRVPVAGDGAPERLELAGYGALSPALAAHRDRLAFVSQRNTISQDPLDTTFTSPPVLASSYLDIEVSFSHDGQRLVFSSTRGGEERGDLDGPCGRHGRAPAHARSGVVAGFAVVLAGRSPGGVRLADTRTAAGASTSWTPTAASPGG